MVLADLHEIEEEMTNAQADLKMDVNKSILLLLQQAKDELDRINDTNTKYKQNRNDKDRKNEDIYRNTYIDLHMHARTSSAVN